MMEEENIDMLDIDNDKDIEEDSTEDSYMNVEKIFKSSASNPFAEENIENE